MKICLLLIVAHLSFLNDELDSISYYKEIGDSLFNINQSKLALDAYKKGATLCEKDGRPEKAAGFYDKLGRIYRQEADYTMAYSCFLKALAIREKINSEDVITSHLYLGSIANYRLNDSLALYHFHQAKNLAFSKLPGLTKKSESGASTINMDEVNIFMKDDFSDESPLHKTLLKMSQSFNNLGIQYTQMYGDSIYSLYKSAMKDSALFYLKNALAIKVKLDLPPHNTHNTINNIGLLYEKDHNYDSALHYYRQALVLRSNLNDPDRFATSLQNIGYIHLMMKEIDSAYYYLNLGKTIAESHNLQTLKRLLYGNLFEFYLTIKQLDSARYYIKKREAIEAEIFKEQNSRQINELRTLYETEKKDNEIAVQNVTLKMRTFQRDFFMVILFFFAVLFIAAILFVRQRQKSIAQLAAKNEEISKQKISSILKDQELESINSMLAGQEKERHRIAEDLHDKLGSTLVAAKLHFNAIKSSLNENNEQYKKAISLIDQAVDDTRNIAHNMLSGVLTKFGLIAALNDLKETVEGTGQIKMTVMTHKLDERLNGEIELNLYRIIQELVSNILKHAEASEIIVQLNRHRSELSLTVEDDGLGFNLKAVRSKRVGSGLMNVESRVGKMDGKLHIDSGKENGTTISIEIPMI